MATSDFFRRTLYLEQDSVADEFYERTVGLVFEKEDEKARIEVRCWTAMDLEPYRMRDPQLSVSGARATLVPTESSSELSKDAAQIATREPGAPDIEDISEPILHTPQPVRMAIIDLDLGQLRRFTQHTCRTLRVFYIRQRNSYSRLLITKDKFNELLHQCQVFPQFRDFVLDFRWKMKETEIGPPRIKFRPSCILEEGTSIGHGFETAYIVRYVELTNRSKKSPWSLRQFAVYHKSVPYETSFYSTWMLVGASQRTEEYFNQYWNNAQEPHRRSPFELHIQFLSVALSSWRPYIAYLVEQVVELSDKAVLTKVSDEDTLRSFYTVEVKDHQRLKEIEDRASDAALCLESTLDTVSTLAEMYQQYFHAPSSTQGSGDLRCEGAYESDAILFALKEKQKEVSYAQKKVEALLAKTRTTRALISSLLERLNGHNLNQQMAVLNSLQRQGHEENAIMRQLAEKGSREAASVKILTIITLIYLPCTVVSSFYSTQFVHQEDTPSGPVMGYAHNAWLFFAVTIPLTFFTIAVWYTWAHSIPFFQAISSERRDNQTEKIRDRMKRLVSSKERSQLPC